MTQLSDEVVVRGQRIIPPKERRVARSLWQLDVDLFGYEGEADHQRENRDNLWRLNHARYEREARAAIAAYEAKGEAPPNVG